MIGHDKDRILKVFQEQMPMWNVTLTPCETKGGYMLYMCRLFTCTEMLTLGSFADALAPDLKTINEVAKTIKKPKRPVYRG